MRAENERELMKKLTADISEFLYEQGAALVGFADLSVLPENERGGMPFAVSIGVKYEKETIETIYEHPTKVYGDAYKALNNKLDALGRACEAKLQSLGYHAIARTTDAVEDWRSTRDYETLLPHKTAARLAGHGWIGNSALLVNESYGSMVRYSTVLTNAPVDISKPVNESQCGSCTVCKDACPAGAVLGNNWAPGTKRSEIFDAVKCRETARTRSIQYLGEDITICGKCIYVCPYTQRYLKSE